jgi:hypothetical protein
MIQQKRQETKRNKTNIHNALRIVLYAFYDLPTRIIKETTNQA